MQNISRTLFKDWILPHARECSIALLLIILVWIFVFWTIADDQRKHVQAVEMENDQLARAFAENVSQMVQGIDRQMQLLRSEYQRNGMITPAFQLIYDDVTNNNYTVNGQ